MKKPTKGKRGATPTRRSHGRTDALVAENLARVSAGGRLRKRFGAVPTATPDRYQRPNRRWEHKTEEAAEALLAAQRRATVYEMQNRGSGHGLAVVLRDGSVFWSKGWRMCDQGCRVPLDDWGHKLQYEEQRVAGRIVKRFICRITTNGGRSGHEGQR